MKRRDPLTPRQRLFVVAFVSNGGVGRAAAIAAGYSENAADQQASRLLSYAKIQAEVAKARDKLARKIEITGEALVFGMARIAFSDARRLFDADGRLKPVAMLDDDTAAAVSSIEVRTDARGNERITKIRLADKNGGRRETWLWLLG